MNLRRGLWRSWLGAATVWTIAVLWLGRPYLTGDCGYIANLPDHAAWATCTDSMWFSALALLLLPSPLVFVLGYWIVRGFRPDYGRINYRVALGVALMPVWVFIVVGDMLIWHSPDIWHSDCDGQCHSFRRGRYGLRLFSWAE
jgi:hypothetical protein